jgi:hypothetical protein
MKIKTSELEGAALDWAVAKAQGYEVVDGIAWKDDVADFNMDCFSPSELWAQGGPIIEREKCIATLERLNGGLWRVQAPYDRAQDRPGPYYYGPTPLVAAMRCYVASKLGDEKLWNRE